MNRWGFATRYMHLTGSHWLTNWNGRRVTVMGLGRHGGGVAAVRYLIERGAVVTVTDMADESSLAASRAELGDLHISRWQLGGHRPHDFQTAEVVLVNPAVRHDDPYVCLARRCGAVISSEIELFLDACPAKIIGVTGSNGKSTTATMVAAILRADKRRVWLGGNLGGSLLPEVEPMRPEDWVVLELSSFQLNGLSPTARPVDVAIVTNCTPNHLDWHGPRDDSPTDLEHAVKHYVRAKQSILTRQSTAGLAVLGMHDPWVAGWKSLVRGRFEAPLELQNLPELAIPGQHNRQNAACAGAAGRAIGCGETAIRDGLAGCRGLPHRLALVGEVAGRRFYNDSSATTPESVIAALHAMSRPAWLLAGGRSKGNNFGPLAAEIAEHARGAAFYGEAGESLRQLLLGQNRAIPLATTKTLSEAFAWCWVHSQPGEAIVLSPGCSSHDQFADFTERGAEFLSLVKE